MVPEISLLWSNPPALYPEPENLVHILTHYLSNVHSNTVHLSMPKLSKSSLIFRFPDQNFVMISHLSHACHMHRLSHPP
jgi:hypothetical protein